MCNSAGYRGETKAKIGVIKLNLGTSKTSPDLPVYDIDQGPLFSWKCFDHCLKISMS